MTEAQIERYLRNAAIIHGVLCYKWTAPGNSGVPDRILLPGDGRVIFVELKTKTGKLEPTQVAEFARLERAGYPVHVLRSKEDIDALFVHHLRSP